MLMVVLMHTMMRIWYACVKQISASAELNEVFSGQLLDQTFQFQLQECR